MQLVRTLCLYEAVGAGQLKFFTVVSEIIPNQCPGRCTRGVKGVVEHLDADGDAQVRFPALSGLRCTLRCVLAADFVHLSRLTASDAAESAAA